MSDDSDVKTVNALAKRIGPILAGQGPDIQGAVLAELLSMWLAGHPEQIREEILTMHIEATLKLVPVNAAIIALHVKQRGQH